MNPYPGFAPAQDPSGSALGRSAQQHSLVGILALVLASLSAVGLFGLFGFAVVAGALEDSGTVLLADGSTAEALLGLGLSGFLCLQLVAMVLSLVGLFEKDRKRLCAVVAVVVSTITLAAAAFVFVIGLLAA